MINAENNDVYGYSYEIIQSMATFQLHCTAIKMKESHWGKNCHVTLNQF